MELQQHQALPGGYGALYGRGPYGAPANDHPGPPGFNRMGYPFPSVPGQSSPYPGYLGYPTSQSPGREGKKNVSDFSSFRNFVLPQFFQGGIFDRRWI